MKYSGEKGNKQFFSKRRQNIDKLNEKIGFFANDGTDTEIVSLGYKSEDGARI